MSKTQSFLCEYCGTQFKGYQSKFSRRFCSQDCYFNERKRKITLKENKELPGKNVKYIVKASGKENMKKEINPIKTWTCLNCDNLFKRRRSIKGDPMFCGPSCRNKGRARAQQMLKPVKIDYHTLADYKKQHSCYSMYSSIGIALLNIALWIYILLGCPKIYASEIEHNIHASEIERKICRSPGIDNLSKWDYIIRSKINEDERKSEDERTIYTVIEDVAVIEFGCDDEV